MADHDKDITLMLGDLLNAGGAAGHSGLISMQRYRALNALVAERNALKQRVAELEAASKPADCDLRNDLICAALTGAMTQEGWRSRDAMAAEVVATADAAIAAMRRGEA